MLTETSLFITLLTCSSDKMLLLKAAPDTHDKQTDRA